MAEDEALIPGIAAIDKGPVVFTPAKHPDLYSAIEAATHTSCLEFGVEREEGRYATWYTFRNHGEVVTATLKTPDYPTSHQLWDFLLKIRVASSTTEKVSPEAALNLMKAIAKL